jgi:hypothetical protein
MKITTTSYYCYLDGFTKTLNFNNIKMEVIYNFTEDDYLNSLISKNEKIYAFDIFIDNKLFNCTYRAW